MGKTTIEWTDASWNPVTGCTEVSPGCANCYAARLAATRLKYLPAYKGLAVLNSKLVRPRWTGEVRLHPGRLTEPLHWKKPRRIFVCDMSDLFHESVPDEFLYQVFTVMALNPWHTFQVLTKRPARMHKFIQSEWDRLPSYLKDQNIRIKLFPTVCPWPLPNVWLGVSVENQHFADERIPLLLQTPAAVRFISIEPLLGPVDLRGFVGPKHTWESKESGCYLDWIIVGGESGPGARPMHPDWARSLRDQCQSAGVPFFFKQWGEWSFDQKWYKKLPSTRVRYFEPNAEDGTCLMYRIGKKKAGRLLDGREWSEFPQRQAADIENGPDA